MSGSALEQTGTLVCLFELANRMFAVEIGGAREARVVDDYTVVPLAPAHLIGMTSVRGAIVPIVDVRVLLGLPASARMGQTLVVEANAVRVALAVDRVLGVEALEEHVEPPESRREPVAVEHGCLQRGDDVVPMLDVAKIVESLGGTKEGRG